ncbi:class I SAM-dependent methyltransferase [Streptomyces sp. MBT62]|uniref:class I SAM-dependent DNA methyltransferase n=1 Tax=Streptomyces sp. MBT62 TaxID=2800410 RepID=UPI00190C5453|nr:class I SAM-dependent methyltransferase [Streptomyces sp. MBT62]MBK3566801.1 class I SAM-dependent methyltransferase [Streptomyces sp. MBT62]
MTDPNADLAADFIEATRSSYDAIAPAYSAEHPDSLAESPLDRSVLTAFADLVRAGGEAPVADVGSGPGYVTARLNDLGVPAFGIDISPRMVALAREAHPRLRFEVGSMTALEVPDGTLGGVVALYSTIHIPDDRLPGVFAEFHRALRPGGHVLLGFQAADDEHLHLSERYGQDISLDYYFRTPARVASFLTEAGLPLHAEILRKPQGEQKRPRAFVLAGKPAATPPSPPTTDARPSPSP